MKLTATVEDFEKSKQDYHGWGRNHLILCQTCIWVQAARRTLNEGIVYKVGYSRVYHTHFLDYGGQIWYLPPAGKEIAKMNDHILAGEWVSYEAIDFAEAEFKKLLPVTIELYQEDADDDDKRDDDE